LHHQLEKYLGQRATFYGIVQGFGKRKAYKGPPTTTILLSKVKDSEGIAVAGHISFTLGKGFAAVDASVGDTVRFCARVIEQVYQSRGWRPLLPPSYRLSFPTKIEKIRTASASPRRR
jgi:hypothetical protein